MFIVIYNILIIYCIMQYKASINCSFLFHLYDLHKGKLIISFYT